MFVGQTGEGGEEELWKKCTGSHKYIAWYMCGTKARVSWRIGELRDQKQLGCIHVNGRASNQIVNQMLSVAEIEHGRIK